MLTTRLLITAAAFACFAAAQGPTAVLLGSVSDSSGARIPGATIRVRSESNNEIRQASSGEAGDFTIANLAPGLYTLTVEKEGFRRMEQKGLELQINQTARLDLRMEVGALSEAVEVTAQAPVLNTDSGVRGDVVANVEIAEMPLNGRNVNDLAYLVPEVSDNVETTLGSGMAVNGARGDNTNFIVDGIMNADVRGGSSLASVPLDAIQEFKMQTSGYPAEFGRLAGGVMTMALKTGTNRLHGSAFEFFRNDLLDARNFFAADKDKLRRNQFGGSLEGPVYIPRIYSGRDRTFFVFTVESWRQIIGNTRLSRVPTLLERQGDFSATTDALGKPVLLRDPLAKGAFPNNRIPASRIHPIAARIIDYYPLPNVDAVNNLRRSLNTESDWDNIVIKLDHRLSSRHTLSGRYLRRWSGAYNPWEGGNLGVAPSRGGGANYMASLSLTTIVTPAVVNEFRAGLVRDTVRTYQVNAGRDVAGDLGITGVTKEPAMMGMPIFAVRDLTSLGDSDYVPFQPTSTLIQAADTLTWVKGRHLVKTGFDVVRHHVFQPYVNDVRGTFNFLGRLTNVPFADLALGYPDNTVRQVGVSRSYLFATAYSAFVQDDIKVRPSLTLNFGLRYELTKPPVDKFDRLASFVPELGKIAIASDRTLENPARLFADAGMTSRIVMAEESDLPRALTRPPHANFAPRFGFAWRPAGDRMVIRGAYGIFYAGSALGGPRRDMGNMFPFAVTQTFRRDTADVNTLTLSTPFPERRATMTGVTNANGYEVDPAPQYLQTWNLTIEREILRGTVFEAGYSGSKGTHLGRRYDINQPFRSPEFRRPQGGFLRPFQEFGTIFFYAFCTNSSYNAATFTLRKRLSSGVFYRVSYVFSKSLDYGSQLQGSSIGGYGAVQDSRNFRIDRGRSDWDARHVLTMNFTVQAPRAWGRIVRGWQLAGTGRLRSGVPFTPRVSNVQLDAGEANRPDRVAGGRLDNPTPERWFDLSAFVPVALNSYRFGNAGRNILDGPGQVAVNLSLSKRFRIAEGHSLQVRWEAFNFTNHANFLTPQSAIDVAGAASITRAQAARTMQLGLRYQF